MYLVLCNCTTNEGFKWSDLKEDMKQKQRDSWSERPPALSDETAPAASPDHLTAQAAPTHPRAQPALIVEACGGLRSPPQAAPKLRIFRPSNR